MRPLAIKFFILAVSAFMATACSSTKTKLSREVPLYRPGSQSLHDTIAKLDSVFFHAYNTCDLDKQTLFYSDSLEFYHDKAGLSTSKTEMLEATKNNVCGKVTRELVEGSIEVYPIKDFGAVEIGYHRFYNKNDKPGTPSEPGKFIIIWKQTGDRWQISRVVSLH